MAELTEQFASNVFRVAIANGQCAEFITTLWDGGSFTLEASLGEGPRLIFLPKEFFDQVIEESE